MMQVVLGFALIGIAACGRLEYLPPRPSGGAGSGAGGFPGGAAPGAGGPGGATAYSGGSGGSGSGRQIPILRLDGENEGDGTYRYAYETGNGIQAREQGDARGDGTRAQGGFSYTLPDGQHVDITYTADENGFVPQGAIIPTPPPIPAEIQRALDQNAADEARGIVDDGQYREDYSGQYRADSSGQYNGIGAGAGAGFGAGAGAGFGRGAGAGAGNGAGSGSGSFGGTSYSQNGGYRY